GPRAPPGGARTADPGARWRPGASRRDGEGRGRLGQARRGRARRRAGPRGRPAVRTPLYRPREGSIPTLGVPSLDGVRSVHLIGIGGAGMRNLARLLLARGIRVT